MKRLELFLMTKREQRVVIVIVLALLAGTVALHYRDIRSAPPAANQPSSTPILFDREEDGASPDESP